MAAGITTMYANTTPATNRNGAISRNGITVFFSVGFSAGRMKA